MRIFHRMSPVWKIRWVFLCLFGLLLLLSLNRHSKAKVFTYHSELWADKAGYNVYLPAVFIDHLKASQCISRIDSLTGSGFYLDPIHDRIVTKYPYGVALMESPFWLIAHALSQHKNGYSELYQKAIDVSGCFYLVLGLYVLFLFFRKTFSPSLSALVCAVIACSGGVFYYGIFETGMPHIYLFCICCMIIYAADAWLAYKENKWLYRLALLAALFVVIRPIDGLFLAILFLFALAALYRKRTATWKPVFKPRSLLISGFIILLICLPQFLYYRYAYGSTLVQPYKNEGFMPFSFQKLWQLLFSSDNGLLVYYPALLLLLVFNVIHPSFGSRLSLACLAAYLVIYTCWWSTSLGCGFGHRAINDIWPLFFIFLKGAGPRRVKSYMLAMAVFGLVNMKFIFSYDGCLFNKDLWSYTEYFHILTGPFK